mmetsp:Transcript_47877/g.125339  ORF Transcript_47877/g.125339 Transcript_47877/m.125339 type:complete len:200 (+) Transcript_47877:406-1005(+)
MPCMHSHVATRHDPGGRDDLHPSVGLSLSCAPLCHPLDVDAAGPDTVVCDIAQVEETLDDTEQHDRARADAQDDDDCVEERALEGDHARVGVHHVGRQANVDDAKDDGKPAARLVHELPSQARARQDRSGVILLRMRANEGIEWLQPAGDTDNHAYDHVVSRHTGAFKVEACLVIPDASEATGHEQYTEHLQEAMRLEP